MRNALKLFIAFLMALYPTLELANENAQIQPQKGLLFRLVIPEPRSCVGTASIAGELILRNLGSSSAAVSLKGLSASFQFYSYSETKEHFPIMKSLNVRMEPWPLGATSRREITIEPDESHWMSIDLPLNSDFFSKDGLYEVSFDHIARIEPAGATASLESLETNSVYFELEDCGSPKPQKPASK